MRNIRPREERAGRNGAAPPSALSVYAPGERATPRGQKKASAAPGWDGEAPWRGSTLLLRLFRPVSRPTRRALPLPLPDALSPRRPEGRSQQRAAPLCLFDAGTLSIHRGCCLYSLPPSGRRPLFIRKSYYQRGGGVSRTSGKKYGPFRAGNSPQRRLSAAGINRGG